MQLSETKRRRSLYALYVIAFLDLFAVSLFLPLLSREIRDLGGDPILIGIIGSVYGAVQLFSSPVMGWCSDQYGAKSILGGCLAATTVAYILQGYSTSLTLFFIARALAGCFKHTQTIGKSIISELSPRKKSYVLGNFNAFGSMGFVGGPTVGAHLVEMDDGFHSVCLLAGAAFVLNIVILLALVSALPPRPLSVNGDSQSLLNNRDKSKRSYFCVPEILSQAGGPDQYSVMGILILRFLLGSSTIIPRSNLPLILEAKYSTTVVSVGYLNSLQALVSTLTGFAVGPVVSKLYKNNTASMVKSAGILKTLSLIALVFAPNFRLAGLTMLFQSAADPFLRVGITSMSLEGHADPGTILGLGQTATSLSRMIAPFVAGLSQAVSNDGPNVVGAFSSFIGLVGLYFVSRSKAFTTGNHYQKKVS